MELRQPGVTTTQPGPLEALIHRLATKTNDAWSRHGFDESVFDEVACDALAEAHLVGTLTWNALQDHILAPTSPEPLQSKHPAPEVIPLYNGRHFKIYAHAWLDKIAEPHHHCWTGAFQVLEGRSLNGYYRFTPREVVRQGLTLGHLELAQHQIHTPGSVVGIKPGSEFIHGLQYLDRPGLAISIRGGRLVGNTCTYYRPGVAVQTDLEDPAVTSILRVLQILHHTDPEAFERRLLEAIPRYDLLTVHLIVFEAVRSGWSLPASLWETASRVFGRRLDPIEQATRELTTLGKIVQLRSRFTDSDLRLFLAILCLGRDRRSVHDLVAEHAPRADVIEFIGQSLASLLIDAEGDTVPDAMAHGLGRLALGASPEQLPPSLAGELLSVIVTVHEAMAGAPIYEPLFTGAPVDA
ncbi:MAG: hypothetical protein K0V04_11010 [Deltaproteobacteria bacterium]|nr:hypothetical protein [Deltaproteobacteria bacterium]